MKYSSENYISMVLNLKNTVFLVESAKLSRYNPRQLL